MKVKRGLLIFIVVISLLTSLNLFFFNFTSYLFPVKGGYSRQILFIKPEYGENKGGYFIILDELAPRSQSYNIDWLLHSRGNLTISNDKQSVKYNVKSYIQNDIISLNASFLDRILEIQGEQGVFCPVSFREGNNFPDVYTSYIKARYSGKENPIMGTILYPKNDSDNSMVFPNIDKDLSGLNKIGNNDFLFYDIKSNSKQFQNPDVKFNGKVFFFRKNSTDNMKLDFFYLKDSDEFIFEEIINFTSNKPVDNILVTYLNKSQISGYVEGDNININIYCPFNPYMVKLNNVNTTYTYSNSIISFKCESSCSFVISKNSNYKSTEKNTLDISTPKRIIPLKDQREFNSNLLEGISHPYILYNSSELENIKLKINDTKKPWNSWYTQYTESIQNLLTTNIDSYEDDQKYHNIYKLALHYAIEKNHSSFQKIKDYLFDMETITHYSSDLRRAHNVQAYAIAYDIIFNNLTSIEIATLSQLLYDHAKPLMRMHLYHRNNHRVVDAGALGLAGLVLNDKEMIDISIYTILDYFYNQNPADGGSFEGYSYMAFAIMETSLFTMGLNRLNGFNFYNDPKFIATLDYIAETLGPIGMPSNFEDCTFDEGIQETLIIAAAQMNNTYPLKSQRYQYIWEQRQNNSALYGASKYGYIKGDNPNFQRILGYNVNKTIKAKSFDERREIWKESSMAYLRYGQENGLFMAFSCKDYDQNHPHQDEASFDLWAYGAYISNNPGYPGWGKPYHTWSQSTEGANSMLIGGGEQLKVIANGLESSISSPYFSMVKGNAKEIYNDPGSYLYTPEIYVLMISVFIMLGVSVILFVQIYRTKSKKVNELDENDIKKPKKDALKDLFIHPFSLQRYLSKSDTERKLGKFLNRIIYLIVCGITIVIYLISISDINNTVAYHSQYHEDKYNLVFSILPFVILGFFTLGTIIICGLIYSLIKIYSVSNRLLIKIVLDERTSLAKSKVKDISTASFFWIFPIFIIAAIILYLSTAQGIKSAIHLLWTELNSINDVYIFLVSVVIQLLRNYFLIIMIGTPFFGLIITTTTQGFYSLSEGRVNKKQGLFISIIGIIFVLIAIFMIYIAFYLVFKSLFSLISIEAIVS